MQLSALQRRLRTLLDRAPGGNRRRSSGTSASQPAPTSASPAGAADPAQADLRFTRAFLRVGRAVLGDEAFPQTAEETPFDSDAARELYQAAGRQQAQAELVRR